MKHNAVFAVINSDIEQGKFAYICKLDELKWDRDKKPTTSNSHERIVAVEAFYWRTRGDENSYQMFDGLAFSTCLN